MTKTESRILFTLREMDAYEAKKHNQAWPDRPAHVFARSLSDILTDVNTFTHGRRASSEREAYNALQRLVERGLIKKTRFEGMAGAITTYVRTEEKA
jgi:hypothetical protein